MGNHAAIGEAVQITSGEVLTWNEIYDCIGVALHRKVKIAHVATDFLVDCAPELEGGFIGDKANSVCFDNSKIKRLVPDYVATMRFDQGVRLSIEYLLSHPEVQIPDEEFTVSATMSFRRSGKPSHSSKIGTAETDFMLRGADLISVSDR